MRAAPSLTWSTFHARSTSTAPYGSCFASNSSMAFRTGAIARLSSAFEEYTGANPALVNMVFRSRSSSSSAFESTSTISRLGFERPFSRYDRCRVEISAWNASASCDNRRVTRHRFSSPPNPSIAAVYRRGAARP